MDTGLFFLPFFCNVFRVCIAVIFLDDDARRLHNFVDSSESLVFIF